MKKVSAAWENLQKEQVRPRTNVRCLFFNQYLGNVQDGFGILMCEELGAFKCVGSSGYTLDIGGISIKPSDYEVMCFGLASPTTLTITLRNNTTVIRPTSTLEDFLNDTATYGTINNIVFGINVTVDPSDVWGIYYFAQKSKIVELGADKIYQLNYKGHLDAKNSSLPYHKLSLETLDMTLQLKFTVAMFLIGYESINEYVLLGCGYYYLENIKKTRNSQTFNFTDCISTMTKQYCLGSDRTIAKDTLFNYICSAGHYYGNAWNWLPRYTFPNYDKSDIVAETSITNLTQPYKKTFAESLQMLALSFGKTLYVDDYNIISTRDIFGSTKIIDDNDIWVLDGPDVEEIEKVGEIKIATSKYVNPRTEQVVFETNGANMPYTYHCSIYGEYMTTIKNNGVNVIGDDKTYCAIRTLSDPDDIHTYTATVLSHSSTVEKELVINNDSETSYTVETLLPNAEDLVLVSTFLQNWFSKNKTQSMNVRLDPKYSIGDRIESSHELYSDFIITDIQATYNGSYKGNISGIVMNPLVKKPQIQFVNTPTTTNYQIGIYNPNLFEVQMTLKSSDADIVMTLAPLQTIVIDSDLDTTMNDYLFRELANDVYCYFEDTVEGVTSENVVILEKNNTTSITLNDPIVQKTVGANFNFLITNNNDWAVNVLLTYSGGLAEFVLMPHESKNFDNSSQDVNLGADVLAYRTSNLIKSVYVSFYTGKSLSLTNVVILLQTNKVPYIPQPALLHIGIVGTTVRTIAVYNPNNTDLVLHFTNINATKTIQANSRISINSLSFSGTDRTTFQQFASQYVAGTLTTNFECWFDDSDKCVLLQANNI